MRKRGLFEHFQDNKCRLCSKVFCCKRCREKHEISKHNIIALDCDICIYGKIRVSSISENSLSHIKIAHWPLHCVCCSRIFTSAEELFQNRKCAVINYSPSALEKSPFSPLSLHIYNENKNYQSPPHLPLFEKHQKSNLVTSTPMQSNEENNFELKKIQEVITPVDSILKKGNLESEHSDLPKRRVTFSTPVTDNEQNASKTGDTNPKDITSDSYSQSNWNISTYYSAQDFTQYYQMIMDKMSVDVSCNIYKDTPKLPGIKKNEVTSESEERLEIIFKENKTLWISAVNTSFSQDIPESLVTSAGTNSKRKQINDMPATMIETFAKCTGAIQISSTPNSSIIPIQSIPTAKDIFQACEPSKSTLENCNVRSERTDLLKENENCHEHSDECLNKNPNNSLKKNIWTSVRRIMKNVASSLQNISSIEGISSEGINKSLKRYSSDNDLLENPPPKRYKLTEIKCRPSIRGLPRPREEMSDEICINIVSNTITKTNILRTNFINNTNNKTFVDKSTQTDEYLYNTGSFFTNLFRQNPV